MQSDALKYVDERDRRFGLAGMAIAMVVWDGQEQLAAINVDSEPGEGLEFTPDFYFSGNPRLSARLAWQMLVKQLELESAMLVSNVMCRQYIGRGERISSAMRARLRALVRDEAQNVCSLEDDETERIFTRVNNYLEQLFQHPAVAQMAHQLEDNLQQTRRLTVAEVMDVLRPLSHL